MVHGTQGTRRARTTLTRGLLFAAVAMVATGCDLLGLGGQGGLRPPEGTTNLTATPIGPTEVRLNWGGHWANLDGFRIERWKEGESRSEGAVGTGRMLAGRALINTTPTEISTYADTGLQPDTTYTYRVSAYNAAGQSASDEAIVTTPPTTQQEIPAAPTALLFVSVTTTGVQMQWSDHADNEQGFRIQRRTGTAGSFADLATVAADTTTYADNGLQPDTTYTYSVSAYNVQGYSQAVEATATTLAALSLDSLSEPAANTAVVVLGDTYPGSDFVPGQEYVFDLGLYFPPGDAAIEFRKSDVGLGNARVYFDIQDVSQAGPVTTDGDTNDFYWSEPGGQLYFLVQPGQIDITTPYSGTPGSSFTGEGAFVVASSGNEFTVFVKFNKTEEVASGETTLEFLADFYISHVVAGFTAAFSADEDPDPDTFVATVAGTNGGTMTLTQYTDPDTGTSTATYVYTGYDESGTSYTSDPPLVEVLDGDGNGTVTGSVQATGAHQGFITASLTNSGGVYTGTWSVSGTTYSHAELQAYIE